MRFGEPKFTIFLQRPHSSPGARSARCRCCRRWLNRSRWLNFSSRPIRLCSVVPLILGIVSNLVTLVFLAVLVVMFTARHVPQHTARGFYQRYTAVVGTFLGVGITLLPPQELSSLTYLGSMLLIMRMSVAICAGLALGRSISLLPEARRLATWASFSHPPSALSWRDVCHRWNCVAALFAMGALLVGLLCIFQFQRM